MESGTKNSLVEIGSNIAGGIVAKSLSEVILPGSSILGEVIGPVVTAVTGDIAQRLLSHSENNRVVFVCEGLVAKIQERLDSGEQPRRDEDFYIKDEYGQSSASKLLEEMLLKTKQEFEAKKLKLYSNFWPNICFENGITYETANSLIGLFSDLSYQQIKILIYLNSGASIHIGKWEKYMYRDETLSPYYTLYSDCLHLYSVRLAAQHITDEGSIQLGTPEICISPSGKLLCKLLELKLGDDELSELESFINSIDKIVDRLMRKANDDGSDRWISPISENRINEIIEGKKDEIIEAARPKLGVKDGTLIIDDN